MEILSLNDISTYAMCPAYYWFSKTIAPTPESHRIKLIRSIIQKCYLRIAEAEWRTDWRLISGWVDRDMYENIDMSNKAAIKAQQLHTEKILLGLKSWYKQIYLREEDAGFANIKLKFNIGKFRIEDTMPIVKSSEIPSIIIIDDVEIGARQLYNSFIHRGYSWLFSKEVDSPKVRIEHLSFGPLGSFQHNTVVLNTKDNASTEQRITNILYCMNAKVNYPSITSMCNECQFRSKCNI